MENPAAFLLPLLLLGVLVRCLALPVRWGWKLFLNSAGGFACLWLLNSVSAFTGLYCPINAVTAAVAGFLGLPGIGVLIAVQYIL